MSQKDKAEQRETQAGQDASPAHKYTLAQDFVLDSPLLWDIDTPYLYEVVARLYRGGQPVDELRVRTGLRSIDFRADTGFWLNGRQCKINGVMTAAVWELRCHPRFGRGALKSFRKWE